MNRPEQKHRRRQFATDVDFYSIAQRALHGRHPFTALLQVPLRGELPRGQAYILPLPEVKDNGDVDIITLVSRQGWEDCHIYDAPWKDADQDHCSCRASKRYDLQANGHLGHLGKHSCLF